MSKGLGDMFLFEWKDKRFCFAKGHTVHESTLSKEEVLRAKTSFKEEWSSWWCHVSVETTQTTKLGNIQTETSHSSSYPYQSSSKCTYHEWHNIVKLGLSRNKMLIVMRL